MSSAEGQPVPRYVDLPKDRQDRSRMIPSHLPCSERGIFTVDGAWNPVDRTACCTKARIGLQPWLPRAFARINTSSPQLFITLCSLLTQKKKTNPQECLEECDSQDE